MSGSSSNPISSVSDTARLVAMYRAMESERPDASFRDPCARRLAGPAGEQILASMPQGRRWAWPMIVRTAVMDEVIMRLVTQEGVDTVLNLAAGLDARAYRLDLPAQLRSGNAPMIFAPAEGTAFFAPTGWGEAEYHAILDEALRLKRAPRMSWVWRLLGLLASKQRRAEFKRFSGIVLLQHHP